MDNELTNTEQKEVQLPVGDFIDLEKVRDINRIFAEINLLKGQLADLAILKGKYAAAVNELYEISINDSQCGEEISRKALELGMAIQVAQAACKQIKLLELELSAKYGFLSVQTQAA